MALTATATTATGIDIIRRLGLRDPVEVHTGFDRPNLTFDAIEAAVAPRAPVGPSGPCAPVGPTAPVGPVAPVGPCGPCAPVGPA